MKHRASLQMLGGSIGGLMLGLAIGSISHTTQHPALAAIGPYISAAGTAWLNALSALVIPLTVSNVITAVVRGRDARLTGAISARAFALFVIWLTLGALVTFALVPPLLQMVAIDRGVLASLTAGLPAEAIAAAKNAPTPTSPSEFVAVFIPRNLLASVINGELLPALIFSIAFAFAVTRSPEGSRQQIAAFFSAVSDALLVLVRWLLVLMPLGAFALAFVYTDSAGASVAGVLGTFTLVSCVMMLLVTLLLYPLTAALSGVSMRRFARGVLPAQIAAVTTRSSIASLPALLEGASVGLRISSEVANLTLPLSVAVFKLNRTVSSTIKLLFISHLFGIPLSAMQLVVFTVSIMIVSFTSLGLPGGGAAFKSMAIYTAMGLPLEGYVLMETTDVIVDVFKTLLNVTGNMSVASVVERLTQKANAFASSAGMRDGGGEDTGDTAVETVTTVA